MVSEVSRRRLAGAALVAMLCALVWLATERLGSPPPPETAAVASGDVPTAPAAEDRPTAPRSESAASTALPARSPAEIAALEARDARRFEALRPLEMAVAQRFEGCVGARPGPRAPLPLMVHFKRDDTPAQDGQERFRVVAVVPVGSGAALGDLSVRPEGACLAALNGMQVEIPAGTTRQPDEFHHPAIAQIALSVGLDPARLP